jgi:transposase
MSAAVSECCVGVDWGHQFHQVCIVDASGNCRDERRFPQSAAGLSDLVQWLRDRAGCAPPAIRIAIERPHGPVVEALLLHDFAVYAVNPKQLDRFRDRHTVAGAKDDRRDALVLADSLRTDPWAFTALQLGEPTLIELRELVRIDEDLRDEENAQSNRLRELLLRYFPAMHSLMADRADPLLWSLLELAPTPLKAARLSLAKITALLQKHRVRRLTAEQIRNALQTTPLEIIPSTVSAASSHVSLLIPRLRLLHQQRRACGKKTEKLLVDLATVHKMDDSERGPSVVPPNDAAILSSLPGVGKSVLAAMLVEAAGPLARRDLQGLRALGGIAPVTRRSGKQNLRIMRRACNARLRYAFYHWGRTAVQRDPHAKHHYAQLRRKGHTHGRALRGVVDRLLSVAVAMLKQGALYDCDRRQHARTTPALSA